MLSSHRPDINSQYTSPEGEQVTVIGTGTNGIVVEFQDGRVQLLATPEWESLGMQRASEQKH
ncbi:MAG: hypothetical protein OEZ43_00570 [Gammaproteobacteria bacterium]|nr:hypothetical protein [Gammaproteobacteria bacterium]